MVKGSGTVVPGPNLVRLDLLMIGRVWPRYYAILILFQLFILLGRDDVPLMTLITRLAT